MNKKSKSRSNVKSREKPKAMQLAIDGYVTVGANTYEKVDTLPAGAISAVEVSRKLGVLNSSVYRMVSRKDDRIKRAVYYKGMVYLVPIAARFERKRSAKGTISAKKAAIAKPVKIPKKINRYGIVYSVVEELPEGAISIEKAGELFSVGKYRVSALIRDRDKRIAKAVFLWSDRKVYIILSSASYKKKVHGHEYDVVDAIPEGGMTIDEAADYIGVHNTQIGKMIREHDPLIVSAVYCSGEKRIYVVPYINK